jgi:hypothetical protein
MLCIFQQEGFDVAGGPLGEVTVPPPYGIYVQPFFLSIATARVAYCVWLGVHAERYVQRPARGR